MEENLQPDSEFDEITGELKPEAEFNKTVERLDAVISQSNAFQEMKRTKGWAILMEFVNKTIASRTETLILEVDFEKIRRIQSEIIAFSSLEALIDNSFREAEVAREHLKSLGEE